MIQVNSHASPHRSLGGVAVAAVVAISSTAHAAATEGSAASAASAVASASAAASAPHKKKVSVVPSSQQLDINSASRTQLKALPGIGDAEAAKIIAARPYYSKTDLVTRNVLPEGSYAAIKYKIFAAPPAAKPNTKK